MPKQAVLLLAHGTPETVEQIPEYLRNVVSGRPLPESVITEIQHRYSLIGRSPLTEITMEQARLVELQLAESGQAVPVYVGMRNWRPYIPEVVRQMRADGTDPIVDFLVGRDADGGEVVAVKRQLRDQQQQRQRQQRDANDIVQTVLGIENIVRLSNHESRVAILRSC